MLSGKVAFCLEWRNVHRVRYGRVANAMPDSPGRAIVRAPKMQRIDPPPRVAMLIVHVVVHVRADSVDAFSAATLENARNSILEPGVVRFDVVQQDDDPTRFLLMEIYRTPDDPARHKATAHYAAWREAVELMMAEPRRSVKYHALFPEPDGWERPG
ncbi:MAG TPA: putative quinol monooxygenase [Gemmatimonadaceae bacterium]|nr:putative quinol monooxygenase [Gemmatimonadaceae bacterium]